MITDEIWIRVNFEDSLAEDYLEVSKMSHDGTVFGTIIYRYLEELELPTNIMFSDGTIISISQKEGNPNRLILRLAVIGDSMKVPLENEHFVRLQPLDGCKLHTDFVLGKNLYRAVEEQVTKEIADSFRYE